MFLHPTPSRSALHDHQAHQPRGAPSNRAQPPREAPAGSSHPGGPASPECPRFRSCTQRPSACQSVGETPAVDPSTLTVDAVARLVPDFPAGSCVDPAPTSNYMGMVCVEHPIQVAPATPQRIQIRRCVQGGERSANGPECVARNPTAFHFRDRCLTEACSCGEVDLPPAASLAKDADHSPNSLVVHAPQHACVAVLLAYDPLIVTYSP